MHKVKAKLYAWRKILKSSTAHRVGYPGEEKKIFIKIIIIVFFFQFFNHTFVEVMKKHAGFKQKGKREVSCKLIDVSFPSA